MKIFPPVLLAILLAPGILIAGCDSSLQNKGDASLADLATERAAGELDAFAVIAEADVPDVCSLLTEQTAIEGLGVQVQDLTSSPHSCDYFAAELAEGESARSMNLAVMSYPPEQFSSAGAYGSELAQRLVQVTTHDRLEYLGDDDAGSMFLGDEGMTSIILIVPRVVILAEGQATSAGEVVIFSQLDNEALGPVGRKDALTPTTRELALAVKSRASER